MSALTKFEPDIQPTSDADEACAYAEFILNRQPFRETTLFDGGPSHPLTMIKWLYEQDADNDKQISKLKTKLIGGAQRLKIEETSNFMNHRDQLRRIVKEITLIKKIKALEAALASAGNNASPAQEGVVGQGVKVEGGEHASSAVLAVHDAYNKAVMTRAARAAAGEEPDEEAEATIAAFPNALYDTMSDMDDEELWRGTGFT